jgi:hypothetical protein
VSSSPVPAQPCSALPEWFGPRLKMIKTFILTYYTHSHNIVTREFLTCANVNMAILTNHWINRFERLLPDNAQSFRLEHIQKFKTLWLLFLMIARKQNVMNWELVQYLLFKGNNVFPQSEIWDVHFALYMEEALCFVCSSTRGVYIIIYQTVLKLQDNYVDYSISNS